MTRVLLFILSIGTLLPTLGFLDFIVVPKLILPSDICYYHNHDVPFWVDLLYLDSSGHTEPPFTGLHILLLFLLIVVASVFLSAKLMRIFSKNRNAA